MNDLHHNQPPDMAITAGEVTKDLSGWMAENPIIETEEQARQAKEWNDRAYLCIQDLEDERKEKTRPHREQIEKISGHYYPPRDLLQEVVNELKSRLDQFIFKEEAARRAAADVVTRIAREAEETARHAKSSAQSAIDESRAGVLGIDAASAIDNANQAITASKKAQRQAQIAQKDIPVRIGGGIRSRVMSARNTDVLHISNPVEIISAVGLTEGIKEALKVAARAYKRLHGKYPNGITVTVERGI